MSGAAIVLSLVLTMAAPHPEELTSKLGAARYADREAAAAELEHLGKTAMTALKAARTHRDHEIRSRAEALLVKIEGSLLLQPTLVPLDVHDRPVGDVLQEINRLNGPSLRLDVDPRGAFAARRVSLQSREPVPFWSAVDRICNVAGLQYSFTGRPNAGLQTPSLVLTPGDLRPAGPMSDHGPFRVNLMSLHYQRDLTFGTNAETAMPLGRIGQPVAQSSVGDQLAEQFYLRLQVAAEPQLHISQAGTPKVVAATDDLGQSLLVPSTGATPAHMSGYFGMPNGPVQFQVFLKRPEKPGRTIRLLRGSLPLHVSTRRPESLEIPLAGASGKTSQNEDASVTVHEIKSNPSTRQTTIELSVVPKTPRAATNPGEMEFMMPRIDVGPTNLELADPQGKPIPWYVSGSNQMGDDVRLTLTVNGNPSGAASTPTTLRYFGMIRATTEVPFEFRNVPMP